MAKKKSAGTSAGPSVLAMTTLLKVTGTELSRFLKKDRATIDNIIFRLHYRFSAPLMALIVLLLTATSYFGKKIQCTGSSLPVMENYCFVESTYTLIMNNSGMAYPGVGPLPRESEIPKKFYDYYIWIPYALTFHAFLFYLPRQLWKAWEGKLAETLAKDLELNTIFEADLNRSQAGKQQPAKGGSNTKSESNGKGPEDVVKEKAGYIANYILHSPTSHNSYMNRLLVCECLNLIVVVCQFIFADILLRGEFRTYGPDIIDHCTTNRFKDQASPIDKIFPKMTKCTFYTFGPSGTIETHDSLCLLSLNILIEKVYIFLWFWLIILFFLDVVCIIYRIVCMFNTSLRKFRLEVQNFTPLHIYDQKQSEKDIFAQKNFEKIAYRDKTVDEQVLESLGSGCYGNWFMALTLSKNIDPLMFSYIAEACFQESLKKKKEKEIMKVRKQKSDNLKFPEAVALLIDTGKIEEGKA